MKGASGMEVHLTDTHGRITARDTYESVRNAVSCTGIERLCEDGRGMVRFTADEAALINRLGRNGRKDTAANFEKAMQGLKDGHEKKTVGRAARKLSELSEESCAELTATTKNRKLEESCAELTATTKNRKLSERDFSVRYRLSKIREQRKEKEAVKGNDMGRKTEKGGPEL